MLTWGILGGGALWVVEALGGEGCRHGGAEAVRFSWWMPIFRG